ncbi:hypothetical protein [Lysobacter gummosus]
MACATRSPFFKGGNMTLCSFRSNPASTSTSHASGVPQKTVLFPL